MTGVKIEDSSAVVECVGLVHVFPLFGRKHILDGWGCWCEPLPDSEHPEVVIHHAEH